MNEPTAYTNRGDHVPHEKSDSWKKSIYNLMHDFCIPRQTVNQIIHTVEIQAAPNETCGELYNKAWNLFKKVLMQSL